MQTERRPGHYDELRETHRRVAEEEEKCLAEVETNRSTTAPEQDQSTPVEQPGGKEDDSPEARYAALKEGT
jgi:predicted AAA+ superfamily ATPase